jgi:hypothetical protein
MDMRKYSGDTYLSLEDLRASGPFEATIESVEEGKFDKPVLVLSDGTMVQVNKTNNRKLVDAWGRNSDDWIGKAVKILITQVPIKDPETKKDVLTDMIAITPISPALALSAQTAPVEPDIDDDIPF